MTQQNQNWWTPPPPSPPGPQQGVGQPGQSGQGPTYNYERFLQQLMGGGLNQWGQGVGQGAGALGQWGLGQGLNAFGNMAGMGVQSGMNQLGIPGGPLASWALRQGIGNAWGQSPYSRPPYQTQAPFQEPQGPWNMQGQQGQQGQGGQGGLPPWMMPPQQGAPLGPAGGQQGIGGFQTPYGMGGGFSNGQASNGGPWWTDPYGNQSFSGFDWNQVVPWGNAQYTPGGPSPFAGQPVGAWEDITNNLRTMGYLDQQAFDQNQQGIQNNQWDRTFNANQGQQGIQNSQWDRNFAQQGSQWDRNFNANQAQQGIQNNQWDRTFGSNEAQRGWQNNFTQNEANRAADQWGQTFGANQAQQGWNNQYQTGRANAADSQWGQTFGANENQRGIENTRNAALDQWNQAFSQAGFDWRKQQDTEQNRLQDQGQNLAAFGRRFGPNVSYM